MRRHFCEQHPILEPPRNQKQDEKAKHVEINEKGGKDTPKQRKVLRTYSHAHKQNHANIVHLIVPATVHCRLLFFRYFYFIFFLIFISLSEEVLATSAIVT